MTDGLVYETHTFGESQTYLEGWYTLDELKELIARMEIANDRHEAATKYLMGETK